MGWDWTIGVGRSLWSLHEEMVKSPRNENSKIKSYSYCFGLKIIRGRYELQTFLAFLSLHKFLYRWVRRPRYYRFCGILGFGDPEGRVGGRGGKGRGDGFGEVCSGEYSIALQACGRNSNELPRNYWFGVFRYFYGFVLRTLWFEILLKWVIYFRILNFVASFCLVSYYYL